MLLYIFRCEDHISGLGFFKKNLYPSPLFPLVLGRVINTAKVLVKIWIKVYSELTYLITKRRDRDRVLTTSQTEREGVEFPRRSRILLLE